MALGQKYHVSLNSDGKWKVKGENSEKTLKLFATQKEAIEYAKTVAGNQEGNIVIHKVDGKIRKQDYSTKTTKAAPQKEEKKAVKGKEEVKDKKAAPKKDEKAKPSKTVAKKK